MEATVSTSNEIVSLKEGFSVPKTAYDLAIECERLGVQLIAESTSLGVEGPHTPELLQQLRLWKSQLLLILNYTPSDQHLFDRRPAEELPDVRGVNV
jgi:hypothetical protein